MRQDLVLGSEVGNLSRGRGGGAEKRCMKDQLAIMCNIRLRAAVCSFPALY